MSEDLLFAALLILPFAAGCLLVGLLEYINKHRTKKR
jgi:hypothetical protein